MTWHEVWLVLAGVIATRSYMWVAGYRRVERETRISRERREFRETKDPTG